MSWIPVWGLGRSKGKNLSPGREKGRLEPAANGNHFAQEWNPGKSEIGPGEKLEACNGMSFSHASFKRLVDWRLNPPKQRELFPQKVKDGHPRPFRDGRPPGKPTGLPLSPSVERGDSKE
ncbi:hypothetical protein HNY73_021561 [Argiope bruennichi]|uniref:Uncharacterized protein n=1 Tax=Argiope bruennichi TaxID=94029 RepID=A0A8T0DYW5_ARGBR|nr:hypothetical protein HNY73_021561 [Argiope bruennichi]